MRDLFTRCKHNPLITTDSLHYLANTVFNAGAADLGNQILLLLRVESCSGRSHLTLALSENGVSNWHVEDWALLHPGNGHEHETFGVEDARITWMDHLRCYIITYTAYSEHGPTVGIAKTLDFRKAERVSIAFPPDNKDAVIFPRKIKDNYVMLHRPSVGGGSIWIGYSPDLIYWGKSKVVITLRGGPWWDGHRVGAGLPPIETEHGWLIIYHGVKEMVYGPIYRVGAALLDLEDPSKLIGRTKYFIMTPSEPYERMGDVPNVIFPTGGFIRGKDLWIYYGAADSSVCLATAPISDIIESVSKL
jgi:beta-1,4-mannooligosaccharide/beta-1,4-mannosyl-N-acetylglucosamine phosphorylase